MNRGDRREAIFADDQDRRKGDAKKVKPALELWNETTMSLAWIAQRLHMGTRGHVAWLSQRHNPKGGPQTSQA